MYARCLEIRVREAEGEHSVGVAAVLMNMAIVEKFRGSLFASLALYERFVGINDRLGFATDQITQTERARLLKGYTTSSRESVRDGRWRVASDRAVTGANIYAVPMQLFFIFNKYASRQQQFALRHALGQELAQSRDEYYENDDNSRLWKDQRAGCGERRRAVIADEARKPAAIPSVVRRWAPCRTRRSPSSRTWRSCGPCARRWT